MFNTLKYVTIMEESGFSRNQAETSVKILVEIMEDKLATKQDIKDLQLATKHELHSAIQELRTSTQHDIQELRTSTQRDFQELRSFTEQGFMQLTHTITQTKSELKIWIGSMFAVFVGLMVTLTKFVH